jgi:D-alanyl-D-alanine carboxypeptidase
VQRGAPLRPFLGAADTSVAFVDGDDLLALVNRSPTGALPPGYRPSDLVDVRDGSPHSAADCDGPRACLRREAAGALRALLDAMRADGMTGRVVSAYRGFGTQCWVFANWASQARGGFCEAAEQSALPGHSQHQLGTTVDLFTADWAAAGDRTRQGVFRNGFGCTRGGRWLDEHAWPFGFVVPYPIHPDDRKDGSRCAARADRAVSIDPKTGYKNEPWHLRYIGAEAAARYHQAWLDSGPGTPGEISLEQWLRAARGLAGDSELPVCDGCTCGACATLAGDDRAAPCGAASLRLDAQGRVLAPGEPPAVADARARRMPDGTVAIDVTVRAPAHTPTQPPVTGPDGPAYPDGSTYLLIAPSADLPPRAYPDLPGAWRVAVEPVPPGATRWPWRASLAGPSLATTWNGANLVLPARSGDSLVRVRVALPRSAERVRVTLLRDGAEHDTRELAAP